MIGMVAALEYAYGFYPRENVLDNGLMPAGIVSQPHFRSADLPIVFILAPTASTKRNIGTRPKKAVKRLLSVSRAGRARIVERPVNVRIWTPPRLQCVQMFWP
jgi:hypothetical protein